MGYDKMEMNAFLESLPVDTGAEREALVAGSAEKNRILVAGGADSGVLTLVPAAEPLFFPEDVPGCAVTVEYGDEFSIRVVDSLGEAERYRSGDDFRHYWGHRLEAMRACAVTAPAALLRRVELVFCRLEPETAGSAAAGCSGCVLVIPGDGGCLSEADTALCQSLREVWRLGGRTSLVLRLRSPFTNDLLPLMAEQLLERNKLGAFAWGDGVPDLPRGGEALESAVLDILDRDVENVPDQVALFALRRVRDKLLLAAQEADREETRLREQVNAGRQATAAFQAMCLTEKYSLSSLLTQEDKEHLRKEIHDMFLVLQTRFPDMVEEAAEQLPTAKEDLKNLAGDYLGALTDGFVDELLDEATRELLVPRTKDCFLSVCQRFRRLAQEYGLDPELLESQAEAEFLRISEVNVGDFHTDIAQVISAVVATTARLALRWVLQELELFGCFTLLDQAESWVQQVTMELTDRLLPTRMYAHSLCKQSLNYLQTMEESLYRQLEETVIPRLIHVLQQEFDTMTGVYTGQLENNTAAAEQALAGCRCRRAEIAAALEAMEAYLPAQG